MSARATINPTIRESKFQDAVIAMAQRLGWTVAHFRPAQTANGWRTPVMADGQGFPDIVLAKPGHAAIFAELKTEKGTLSAHQERWADVLTACPGVIYRTWRPSDMDDIERLLRGEGE